MFIRHPTLILALARYSSAICSQSPSATIQNGVVFGITTSLPEATVTVNKFLGIPYADSPPQRFSAPAAAPDWNAPRNATVFGPACLQQSGVLAALSYKEPVQSEDCLYVNVYQPSGQPPDYGWPVMVWIHGGGLQFGSSDAPEYDGAAFAAHENVLFVSFNYRLSRMNSATPRFRSSADHFQVFGFPGAPGLPNLGFLDQRLALSWVQDNIAAFDGDDKKVTIFGESSGGISVDALLTVPPSPIPFRAAIVQSGTVLSNALASLGQNPETAWNQTAAFFNCSLAGDQVACLRDVPALQLQAFASNNSLPTIVKNDNLTYLSSAGQQYADGQAANVPVMVGTTADEGTIFTLGQSNLTAFINNTFALLPQLIPQIAAAYAVGTPGINSERQAIARIFTEVGVQCPSALLARQITEAMNPAWRLDLGVFHSSELPLVFSSFNKTTATGQQYALSNYMRGAWAQFAKDPENGPGWGPVGSYNGTDLGLLGSDGSSGVTVVNPTNVDARCAIFEPIYQFLG
ncbi:Para-nitrobenzyl esterase [Cercospora beticola]|uniref:Para-nitrobenzyl esterase n=1 Tax=Cercospora beticola TaxID=122368 RepID=A0A2G5H7E1_CERBT|nr:Para-nitrobenzyl esterase [Cercospora beticola]PIA88464.1 Para-nitrobenzyl esterase [Cercospora beticola]WPB03910.1 hypothetical protein RHO25_008554 [Cercospora beticola]